MVWHLHAGALLAEFGRLHPLVCLELLTDARLYSLPRREADMVFRIKPFDEPEVISRLLPNANVVHRSNNREVQAQLCSRGAGLAVLPRPLGDKTPNIVAFDLDEPPPGRDTFVGYHRDLRRLTRMRASLRLILDRLGDSPTLADSRINEPPDADRT